MSKISNRIIVFLSYVSIALWLVISFFLCMEYMRNIYRNKMGVI